MSLLRLRTGVICAVSAAACSVAAGAWWVSHDWPFTRAAVIRTLEQRFAREVRIGNFCETWFPPGFVAQDVKFLHRRRKELPPLCTARALTVRNSWTGLLRRHIGDVQIVGLRMTIPPPEASGKSPVMPVVDNNSTVSSVGEIEANDAVLRFLPRDPGGQATEMQIRRLILNHVGGSGVASFQCALKTDKPPGEVNATGTLGPWNSESAAQTSVSGKYIFANADLGVFHGLQGLLSSQGTFTGILSKVEVAGSIDVPQLHVDGSASKVHLTAQYHASVDSHSADTILRDVAAHVGRTTILASGNVSGGKGTEGKTARLKMAIDSGRVEDLLNYFSEEKHPSMTGAVRLRAYVELPPGEGFLKKVRLDGDFGVAAAKFTNPATQEPVNHLGESAQGETKKREEEDPRTILSDLKGHVVARNGTATLTRLSFAFPGSDAEMEGSCNLLAKTVDLHGVLRTDGKLSDASSGFRAVILKVAAPLFKKHHTTVVPFTITGPTSSPSVGLNWKKL